MPSSCGFDADKTAIRQQYLIMRRASSSVSRREADDRIRRAVEALPEFKAARLVLSYISFGDEVDTRRIVEDALAEGKDVAAPLWDAESMELAFYRITSLADLRPGRMGILEPVASADTLVTKADCKGSVCLVPGLVFDGEGYRVGYGGGCYDRFLAFYMGEKLGLARTMQVSSNPLPREAHDIHVDMLVTDSGCFRTSLI